MELYIFDRNLNFQGILESFFSLCWVRKYSKCGGFELHCSLTEETLELLKKGNIVWKKDDIEAGYIEYRSLSQDSEGYETLVVKGKFLTGYLGRRIIWGTETLNATTEVAIRTLITNHAISPTDTDRTISLLTLGDLQNYTQTVDYQTSYSNLLGEVESLANTSELGIRTLVDTQNKQMIFDIYEGINRTTGQSENAPAIFSNDFENVFTQEYIDSLNNYRNIALVAGEGEGSERQFVTVGQGIGLDRYELFVDAKDLQQEEMTDTEYQSILENRGQSKLAETKEIQTFESKINVNGNLKYKTDFDLGDIVTCISKKWGITIDTRITEIKEVYEQSGFAVNVTFGNSIPTLIDKIKQVVK